MATNFLKHTVTDSVRQAQEHYFGSSARITGALDRDALTEDEIAFIQAHDSVYMATISENDWPYIQHRGGRAGLLRVLNPQTLAFADYRGNRQMLSTGNLAANDRVALFLMDYPQGTSLSERRHSSSRTAMKSVSSWSRCPAPLLGMLLRRNCASKSG